MKKIKTKNIEIMTTIKMYYHKTAGGAEYLIDKYVLCPNGDKEGIFEGAEYVFRIDGDITKDAELTIKNKLKYEL